MKNKIADLLAFLIKTEGSQCPPKSFFPVNDKKLLIFAGRNKATPFLFHFLDCSSCKKSLTKKTLKKLYNYQKIALIWPLLYQKEKQSLGKFFREQKIKAVLIKDFSSYPKMIFHQQYLMGTDLDLLVEKEDLPRIEHFLTKTGYQLKSHLKLKNSKGEVYYQEKTFIHPRKHLNLDLHTQLAIPHRDEFHFLNKKAINQITKALFQNASLEKRSFLYQPDKEYFLFSLIVHHLDSDLLKGLRNLLDIIQFANFYDKEVDWKKFLVLAKRFKITNFSYFVLLSGSRIFGLPFPKNLKRNIRIPLRVRFFAPYWSAEKIAIFPPIEKWNIKNKEAKSIFYENFFIKLVLADLISPWRLVRPRILFFILKVGFAFLSKVASPLYRKSSLPRAI